MSKMLRYSSYLARNVPLALLLIAMSLSISAAACSFLFFDKAVFDRVLATFDGTLLSKIGAAFFVLAIFMALIGFLSDICASQLRSRISMQIKEDLVREMLGYEYGFFQSKDSGFVVKRIVEDTEMAAEGVVRVFMSFSQLLQVGISVLVFHQVGWWLLSIYIALACVHLLWGLIMKRPIEKSNDSIGIVYGKLYDFFWELIPGIKEVKLQGLHNYLVERLQTLQVSIFDQIKKNAMYNSMLWALVVPLSWGFFLLVMTSGLDKIKQGEISTGTFIVILGLLQVTLEPLNQLMESLGAMHRARSAMGRIESLLGNFREGNGPTHFQGLSDNIRIRKLELPYDSGRKALNGVDLEIRKGMDIAIVGETGSGKSSIAHVLIKLFQKYEGTIELDGDPLSRLDTTSLRKGISLVSQEVFLFRGSIRENIDLEGTLSDIRFQEICRVAQLNPFLEKLPEGAQTLYGVNGVDFSGGEKQRIAIARCLARDSDIIILDEATSALDTRTEEILIGEMRMFLAGKTLISITHKAKLAELADYVIVVKDGKITEIGNSVILMAEKGDYYRLFH